jgi:hypothetical protein
LQLSPGEAGHWQNQAAGLANLKTQNSKLKTQNSKLVKLRHHGNSDRVGKQQWLI